MWELQTVHLPRYQPSTAPASLEHVLRLDPQSARPHTPQLLRTPQRSLAPAKRGDNSSASLSCRVLQAAEGPFGPGLAFLDVERNGIRNCALLLQLAPPSAQGAKSACIPSSPGSGSHHPRLPPPAESRQCLARPGEARDRMYGREHFLGPTYTALSTPFLAGKRVRRPLLARRYLQILRFQSAP